LVKKLGLEFGALDLIVTPDNEYVFVEINPNGQWAWIQQLCPEIPMRETLTDLLIRGGARYVSMI
jgi:glutathione synthase/RimK-type ligase-like ATP-grasp enzyme